MQVIAIVPAYNEENTVGSVVSVLNQAPLIDDIVVVSDGSTDKTVEVAIENGARVVELKENKGKGGAMKAGLEKYPADVILFLDADLIGLTREHVENLVLPVLHRDADMTVGIFEKGRFATDLAQKFAPNLSGQRAVNRWVLENISDIDMARFGVEIALNRMIEKNQIKVKEVFLENMSHVMKEEKRGVLKGLAARMKMYWEIMKYFTKTGVKK
ncbi:glycosyltransferase family 2 protein [Natranaerofaba carboxydovora]|uniref:glycosyltransferase family 2 protein n=1 Tax=Natranaerofaba carboxydovora TaxID=2742683 RepID=UPI0024026841|nr:glycosyltransferase family 2 protein [Natranaerofaba carboxydovora]UMZ73404.1 Glucosyl-3-phosphoglycerate synthase [Natranaerofaba carboxydovora]